jgi:type IV fimbrial biogenesis protein FimT
MKTNGFTLYELLITLAVIAITLTIAIPSLNKTIQNTRTKTATLALLEAIETTRSTAVFHNQHTILIATNRKWHEGWTLFVDNNNNGSIDPDDNIIQINEGLDSVMTTASTPMDSYVAFIGTGEGRQLGTGGTGGFLAGNIKVCPEVEGDGYKLLLSKGGRTRAEKLSNANCNAERAQ